MFARGGFVSLHKARERSFVLEHRVTEKHIYRGWLGTRVRACPKKNFCRVFSAYIYPAVCYYNKRMEDLDKLKWWLWYGILSWIMVGIAAFLIINYMTEVGITIVMFLFCWGSVSLVNEKKQRQRKRRDASKDIT